MKSPTSPLPDFSTRNVMRLAPCLALAFVLFFGAALQGAETPKEDQLLGVLRSSASLHDKDAACAGLKRVGTARAIPALAELLADKDLSHSARYALESMPEPEAGQALIAALDKCTGQIQAGIVQSLGMRRESKAAPALIELLASQEAPVASAAALALGKIGGPQAVAALQAAAFKADRLRSVVVLDALLMVANQMLADGNRKGASAIFEPISKGGHPGQIRGAAYLGMIRAAGKGALPLMIEGIKSNDGPVQNAALLAVREIQGRAETRALGELLPQLQPPVQIALIAALSQRGDPAACPAVVGVCGSPDADVRAEALRALGNLGDARTVAILAKAAATASDDEKKSARQSLLELKDKKTGDELLRQLVSSEPPVQMEIARALSGRVEKKAVPDLIKLAMSDSDSTRKASFQALGQLTGAADLPKLTQLVLDAKSDTAQAQAGNALSDVCRRQLDKGESIDPKPILAGLSSGSPGARAALLQACSMVVDERVRAALRNAAAGSDTALREAAIHGMTETRDPALMPDLLVMTKEAQEPNVRIMAARGYLRLATDRDTPGITPAERVAAFKQVLPYVQSPEEKWLVLSKLAKDITPESMELAATMLDDPATQNEAAQTVTTVARLLTTPANAEKVQAALTRVLAITKDPKLRGVAEKALNRSKVLKTKLAGRSAVEPPKKAPKGNLPPIPEAASGFRRQQLDDSFRSEGVAAADFNRDGKFDVATGNVIYYSPDYKPVPMGQGAVEYNPGGYSNEFYCYAEDFDKDKWPDLLVVGFPGAKTRLMKNPGKKGGVWEESLAIEKTGNESPAYVDIDKDGHRELVFLADQGIAIARPAVDLTHPWVVKVVARTEDPKPSHGLGVGDINSDGRNDIVCPEGWWEGPADPEATPWAFHAAKLSDEPAQMIVYDVNADGRADVISSSAHAFGFWWYEQTPDGWKKHDIDNTISQLHALEMADINRDGLPDLVTGKRFWAHPAGDPGVNDPAMLSWFELQRTAGQVKWIRHDIDNDSGVGLHIQVTDLNRDGRPDIVVSNKKGVFTFTQAKGKQKFPFNLLGRLGRLMP